MSAKEDLKIPPEKENARKKKRKKKKGPDYTILAVIMLFVAGLAVLLYPNISEYFNSRNASRVVSGYESELARASDQERQALMQEARDYNARLMSNDSRFEPMSPEQLAEYNSILNVDGLGMMCYMEIPKLGLSMSVYHTTEESVLQHYIGHVEGSSLPVGGLGSHSVVSGHRGLPSAELFTNLDRMELGDLFQIHVLGELLTYQVDDISVVLPNEVTQLEIKPDQDWMTLVTCTPYGVNTHRLLVRGTRIPNPEVIPETQMESGGLTKLEISLYTGIGMMILMVLLMVWLIVDDRKRKARRAKKLAKKKGKEAEKVINSDEMEP